MDSFLSNNRHDGCVQSRNVQVYFSALDRPLSKRRVSGSYSSRRDSRDTICLQRKRAVPRSLNKYPPSPRPFKSASHLVLRRPALLHLTCHRALARSRIEYESNNFSPSQQQNVHRIQFTPGLHKSGGAFLLYKIVIQE